MKISPKWLPHPAISVALLLVWLLLNRSFSAGHWLIGSALGVLIPLYTRRFFPERVELGRFFTLIKFLSVVLLDIVIANFAVARLTLGPSARLRPRFIVLPVTLQDDFAVAALMGTVCLTPGTVSAELSSDRTQILLHVLDVEDEAALVRALKQRYEAPIKEIFAC